MKYFAQITVEESGSLYECLNPEQMDFDRSSFDIKQDGSKVIINIQAKDAVALRATINSFTQLIAVYEKAGKLENDTIKRTSGKN